MWALSGRKLETWLPGMWRKLRCLTTFLPQSSTASAQVAEDKGRDWENEELPTVGEDQV